MSMKKEQGFIQGGRGQLNICWNLTPFGVKARGEYVNTQPQRHTSKTHYTLNDENYYDFHFQFVGGDI